MIINSYRYANVTLPLAEFVTIGDAGNAVDAPQEPQNVGYGDVSYEYQIGRYTISEGDIATYNAAPVNSTRQITLDNRGTDKPATISWNEAARYVNWLNIKDGAQPAYKFDTGGVNDNISLWAVADSWTAGGENRYRHKYTTYFLPSENEWYKAAYYDSQADVYYTYATGSDTLPVATAGSTITGEVVYAQPGGQGPADVNNAGGLSPYGTMGQGGNVYEWIESALFSTLQGTNDPATETRGLRGGSWVSDPPNQSNFRSGNNPDSEIFSNGFRVAKTILVEFVTIGDAGNVADTTFDANGAVPYEYRISKYAIRETDIDVYNADPANAGTLQITIDSRGDNKPATTVTWNEAARYINWLNIKDGAQPAYKFDTGGANDNISLWDVADSWTAGGENRYRHKDAKYFLPNENEWYKAAYYKSGGTNAGYWLYPTGSDTPPVTTAGSTITGEAVYSQTTGQGPADVTNAGGLSPYGTMGQGGNTFEWNESAFDGTNDTTTEFRVLRGGDWDDGSLNLQSIVRGQYLPGNEIPNIGFRVAAVPE